MKYYVTYVIDGRLTVEVNANSLEEAVTKADYAYDDANLGKTEVVDSFLSLIEDEDGNYLFER
jgi:hypothetical protein